MKFIDAYMCLTGVFEITAIVDVTGSSVGHIFKIPIWEVRKGLKFVENAMPVDVKALHVFNTKYFVVKLYGE